MTVLAIKLIALFAIAYLFGLFVVWISSFFDNNDDDDFRRGTPDPTQPPDPGKARDLNKGEGKKRLVEVDESYYLEEFDLSKK